jgi:RHS repeat-associated protein
MNAGGVMLEEYNYDPWGKRRNVTDWSYSNVTMPTYTNRGFTGHEHLDEFDLIHMNGRIYDPEIARFLSPDPIIQDPYNLLNYNRYSYCLNNPLKYTDPSGYNFLRFLATLFNNDDDNLGDDGGGGGGGYMGGYGYEGGSGYGGGYGYEGGDGEPIVYHCPGEVVIVGHKINRPDPYGISKDVLSGWATSEGHPMIESSSITKVLNGEAILVDGAVLLDNLLPKKIPPRRLFDNLKMSAAASKLVAQGNVLLTLTSTAAEGYDLYKNEDKATTADYAKYGVDLGLAGAATGLFIASCIPGVNVATWTGIVLFGISTSNTFGLFDPLYRKLNK